MRSYCECIFRAFKVGLQLSVFFPAIGPAAARVPSLKYCNILQPSSCLADRDGDQIYDYASKYRAQMRHQQAKMLMTPQG